MAIPIEEIEGIIEEAEQGHFSIDDLRDLVARYRNGSPPRQGENKMVDIVAIFTGPVEDGVENESGFYLEFAKELNEWASERGFGSHVDEVFEKDDTLGREHAN